VWPTVNSRALASAFDQLQEQSFAFEDCAINVNGVLAEAVCRGSARFVPSVGSRNPRIEPRRWTFHFVRAGTGWRMERVESRSGS
jgi:hypothetical protein